MLCLTTCFYAVIISAKTRSKVLPSGILNIQVCEPVFLLVQKNKRTSQFGANTYDNLYHAIHYWYIAHTLDLKKHHKHFHVLCCSDVCHSRYMKEARWAF